MHGCRRRAPCADPRAPQARKRPLVLSIVRVAGRALGVLVLFPRGALRRRRLPLSSSKVNVCVGAYVVRL
eukprot:5672260-Pyramimonas_sp.AAC.1